MQEKENDSFQRVHDQALQREAIQAVLQSNADESTEEVAPLHLDIEAAFKLTGGFGRFQVLSTIAMQLAVNSGHYLYYCFPYLVNAQQYKCRFDPDAPFEVCSAEEVICPALESGSSTLEYHIDTDYKYYLNNWFDQMDLMCENPVQTNFMISLRLIAYGLAGILFFWVPDRYGRRPTLLINWAANLLAQYIMIFVPTYEARLIGFILQGLTMLKVQVPYVWVAEIVPAARATLSSVCLTSFDSSTLMIACLYFILISRDWLPLILSMTVLSTLALLYALIFIPESPHWLLAQGRVSETIDAFNSMAKFNGVNARIPKGSTFMETADRESIMDANEATPTNLSQLVANNLSLHQRHARPDRVNCLLIVMIMIMAGGVNNGYWMTLFNVTNVEGNKFINGIILGAAEMSSGILSGFLITYTSASTAFRMLCGVSIVFSAINQFLANGGGIATFLTLFIAILGVGGVFTCLIVLIVELVPKTQVGGVVTLQATFAVLSASAAPLVVLYDPPIPYFFLSSTIGLALIVSFGVQWAHQRQEDPDLMDKWDNERQKSLILDHINSTLPHGADNLIGDKTFAFYGSRTGFAQLHSNTFLHHSFRLMETTHKGYQRDQHKEGLQAGDTSHSILVKKYDLQSMQSPLYPKKRSLYNP